MFAAAAAAKLLQSCPTLCDPIDGSIPGSPIPRFLQARTLEWVAISFSRHMFSHQKKKWLKKKNKGRQENGGKQRDYCVFHPSQKQTYTHTHTHTHTHSCAVRISGSYSFQGSFPPQSCTMTPNSNRFPKHW